MSTQTRVAELPGTAAPHPLDPLTTEEYAAAVTALRARDEVHERVRISAIGLREPMKQALAEAAEGGSRPPRQAEAVLHDPTRAAVWEAVVELDGDPRVIAFERVEGVQSGITPEEFAECAGVVRADPAYRAGLERRGIADASQVLVEAWGMGGFAEPHEAGRRLAWCPTWIRSHDGDNAYAHPIEGLYPVVDLNEMRVIRVEDHGVVPVPQESGDFRAEAVREMRDDLRPIDIVQSQGPSFSIDGWSVHWQRWQLRIGFTQREGLVLHQIGYEHEGRVRPVVHRASIAELFIPYGDPSPGTYRKNAFDFGEYGAGPLTNSLELGCDCLGDITYFDVDLCSSDGAPYTIRNAVCLHEEDFGILWKHLDLMTGNVEVRRTRRMVLSSIHTVGNYEYAFYWYLYQDGRIEMQVKLTGIMQTEALAPGAEVGQHGVLVDDDLVAPHHQHLFTFRLDLDVDGPDCRVYEVDAVPIPMGEDNPHGNAWASRDTLIAREGEAKRQLDGPHNRHWRVVSASATNRLGQPTGYVLQPHPGQVMLADPSCQVARRAGFATAALWVTAYDDTEMHAAGDYPNLQHGVDGLPKWIQQDRSLDGTDIVLWHTLGVTHIARPEDWPVMPVEYAGFTLKPWGFFDRNPALDLPPSSHCEAPHA
jgi:primary-amine oxidase